MNKLSYRKDLNGIRAIAIIGVILFHYNINFFDGGLIGIDIFFVLSGYLITSVLLKNENNLSISIFWIKRARRIIPLLLLIIIASIPFAFFLMIPLYFENFAQSVFFTPIFLSNILFWLESGYWDLPSQIKPLLHTWSIAIESQFYILFLSLIHI